MPSFNFGGLETPQFLGSESSMPSENGRRDEMAMKAEQPTTEASWTEGAVFEPDLVPYRRESTQPENVRSFFLQLFHLSSIR
jgi:hypothetical protein